MVLSVNSTANAASAPWDYKAEMKNGNSIKGWAGIGRGFAQETAKATVQGLTVGNYKLVLDVKSYSQINQQTNSALINVCTVRVATNNATSSCNSSIQLPYGEKLTGKAKLVGSTGNTVAEGPIWSDPTHFPRADSGHIAPNYVDFYGEHLGTTNKAYLQENGTGPKINANFQVKSDNWVRVTAPQLPYVTEYTTTLVTPYGSVSLRGYMSYPPAPVINSVTPSTLAKAGGQVVTVKGPNVGYLLGKTPFPIMVDGLRLTDYTIVSNSEIRFTAPAHVAGSADLFIQCWGGSVHYTLQYV